MKYREFSPHEALREDLRCVWILDMEYPEDGIQEVTPDGCVELIFNFGSPYIPLQEPATALPTAFIVGFQNKTIRFKVSGQVRIVAARLRPWAAITLLEDQRTSANTVRGLEPDWAAVVEQLRAFVADGDYDGAAKRLHGLLLERALVRKFERHVVEEAARLLQRERGQVRIEELADRCQLSVRQLERGFKDVIGTTPKVFARTMRFEAAQRALMFEPRTDLTRLAHECGYFDQAHFIKDFKEFAGKTPGDYAAAMQLWQQTLKSHDVVFLQSPPSRPG